MLITVLKANKPHKDLKCAQRERERERERERRLSDSEISKYLSWALFT